MWGKKREKTTVEEIAQGATGSSSTENFHMNTHSLSTTHQRRSEEKI